MNDEIKKVILLYGSGIGSREIKRMTGKSVEDIETYLTPQMKMMHKKMAARRCQLTNKLLSEWDTVTNEIKAA